MFTNFSATDATTSDRRRTDEDLRTAPTAPSVFVLEEGGSSEYRTASAAFTYDESSQFYTQSNINTLLLGYKANYF